MRNHSSQLVSSQLVRKPILYSLAVGTLVLGLLLGYQTPKAIAHGAVIEATQTAVAIKATFDNGDPMANAQVLIYSPSDPKTPWAKGQTDEKGYFVFDPTEQNADQSAGQGTDQSAEPTAGQWEATVRQAGHGGTTTFAVGDAADSPSSISASSALQRNPSAAPMQRWISMAAVIWGFVGTALFFSRKPSGGKA
ncbi:MAG: carboxypeptidase regulatory-like domain-containing protein [Phormidesmis sp.]